MSANVISIRNNFPKVAAALDRLAVNVGNKVMARAMNHTIDQGKAEMARQISKEFRLTVHQAKERLRVSKVATRGRGLKFQVILEARRVLTKHYPHVAESLRIAARAFVPAKR